MSDLIPRVGPVTVAITHRVAYVTLDRPPLNVIDLATAGELAAAFEALRERHDFCAVVLDARGRAFSAGVDVGDHLPDRGAEMIARFHDACLGLAALPCPTIAVVHAAALGGGCELTLVCDFCLAAESASFGQPEILLGVFPPLAAVALPRMIAPRLAAEMLLTGRELPAWEAAHAGLANRVVPDGELTAACDELLARLRTLSADSLRATKQVLALARPRPSAEQVREAERFYVERLLHAPDAIEGLTAFLEKRAPSWAKG